MSHPPPLPLRRNISRSLDSVSEVATKYEKRAPMPAPRPSRPAIKPPPRVPVKKPHCEYEVINVPNGRSKCETMYFSTAGSECQSYDLQTFCKEVELPKAVEITDGFCGPTEDIPIGYQLLIYFQKTTRVVQAKDFLDSAYNIPLNSSLKFAPIDDLHLKPKAGDFSGFYYDSVEEMLQERPSLPNVIQIKGSYTKGKQSVNANNILFPKKIDKSTLGSKVTGLICVKQGGEEIKLPLECACGFSTASEDTHLYLPEYIEYVNVFPVRVVVFGIDNSMQFAMPTTLTLLGEHKLKTLVARSLHCETEMMTEISVDLPIKLRCLTLDNEVHEHERVKKAYETFNSSKVDSVYSLTNTNAQHQAQKQLFAKIRKENKSKYYEIIIPESIKRTGSVNTSRSKPSDTDAAQSSPKPSRHRIFKAPLKHKVQSTDDGDSIDSDDTTTTTSPALKHKLFKAAGSLLPGKHKSPQNSGDSGYEEVSHDIPHAAYPKQEFESFAESLKAEIKKEIKQDLESGLREEVRKLRIDNAHCLQQLARLNETVERLQEQNKITSSPKAKKPVPKFTDQSTSSSLSSSSNSFYQLSPEENQRFLQSLDHLTVLQLLGGMKLEKYKEEFKSACVDGQLLATLSQTELVELKVESSLHQKKLLNVIQGKESAQKYLLFSQEDPYVS